MVRQAFNLLVQPLPRQPFNGLDNTPMEHPPPLLKQPAVGDLMGQGVFEGVFALWKQPGLIEELGGLQVVEAAAQCLCGHLAHGLQQGEGHLRADDGRGLEQTLVLGREPVDARGQHRLHRRWHLDGGQRLCQPIGPWHADERPGLHLRPHTLLQKEGITLRAGDQQPGERRQAGVVPDKGL
jgi:hypothetical protein